MNQKSILEQALLQVETLEEAVKTNAKGILSSTMKEELNDFLKESEEDDDDHSEDHEDEMSEQGVMDHEDEDENEETEDSVSDDEESVDDDELDSLDSEDVSDEDDSEDVNDEFGDDMSDEEFGDDTEDDEFGDTDFDDTDEFDGDTLDMTGASDEEVLKVFKSMKPEDGIIVKKDNNHIEMDLDDDQYIIKLNDESDVDSEINENLDEMSDDDDVLEIELDEEDMDDDDFFFGDDEEDSSDDFDNVDAPNIGKDKSSLEGDVDEAARTKWNPHGNKGGANRAGLPSKKMFKAGSGINEELETLKKQNKEYKEALKLFKEKLDEVAVFNANLAYATKLFTENSTTKQEKVNILKRFDTVSTLTESKSLYKTIKTELETKKPITESIVEKINPTPTSSSSKEVLSESKAYESPQFKRMKELMSKVR